MKLITNILLGIIVIIGFAILLRKSEIEEVTSVKSADLEKVFSDFEMTKEMDEKYKSKTSIMSTEIDSLDKIILRLQQKTQRIPADIEVKSNIKVLEYNRSILLESVADIKVEFEGQIWNRLEIMIKDYSQENNLTLLVSNNNDRNILFTKGSIDITEDLIYYVNQKYRGR
jgi:outer membrane protein